VILKVGGGERKKTVNGLAVLDPFQRVLCCHDWVVRCDLFPECTKGTKDPKIVSSRGTL